MTPVPHSHPQINHPPTDARADPRYQQRRMEFEARFAGMMPVPQPPEVVISPSGEFALHIQGYAPAEAGWNYSQAKLMHRASGALIATIQRNYGMFWHAWVHSAAGDYLLCGEDYQGYSVIDLRSGFSAVNFPEAGNSGGGFCWAAATPSPCGRYVAVEGCYWACPYALAIFDFRAPTAGPLPELLHAPDLDRALGWATAGGECVFHYSSDDGDTPAERVWLAPDRYSA
jgi:hypothetical protein